MFIHKLENLGIHCDESAYLKFETYYEVLLEWNKKMNLTAITQKEEVFVKHFFDSICLIKAIDLNNQTLLDVGSGAGFPSIPLKILFPNLNITIVDSLNKRIKFLDFLAEKLNISIQTVHSRIEDFSKNNLFDIVTARAVAPLNILSEFCLPFVKIEGYFLPLKSTKTLDELNESKRAVKVLGGKIEEVINYSFDEYERYIIKIKKETPSPSKYPRPFQQIKKTPL